MNVFGIWIFKGFFWFFWLNVWGDVSIFIIVLNFIRNLFLDVVLFGMNLV